MKKKLLAIFLCLLMVFVSGVPGVVAAEETETSGGDPISATVNFTDVAPFLDPVIGQPAKRLMKAAANAAENGSTDSNGIEMNKTVTKNDDGTYTIKLESYVTGTVTSTEVTEEIPTDIVLVLDQSGSMDYSFTSYTYNKVANPTNGNNYYYYDEATKQYLSAYYCSGDWWDNCNAGWYTSQHNGGFLGSHRTAGTRIEPKTDSNPGGVQFYTQGSQSSTTRLAALKAAVQSFANQVAEKSKGKDGVLGTKDDVDHRIAVVGFASGRYYNGTYYNYANTEVFVGSNQYTYGTAAQGQYANAFQKMKTAAGVSNISASIGALDANGGTLTNLGLEMANGIFEKNPVEQNKKRNRVVVLFTDGQPGWSSYDPDIASSAITQADTAKKTYSATVYTIGIFSGADATKPGQENGDDTQKANWFMQQVSSNNGTPKNPSYYLSAGDSASLNSIFQQISDNIQTGSASVDLGKETIVQDTLTQQFAFVDGDKTTVTVKTADFAGEVNGVKTWGTEKNFADAKVSIKDDTLTVTNFDFKENYVATVNDKPHGKKLIVSFQIKPKDGFLGGNAVPTNDPEKSGIYDKDGKLVENFVADPETQDVEIKDLVFDVETNYTYLGAYAGNKIPEGELTHNVIATDESGKIRINLDPTANNYGLEAWQNQYVTIDVKKEYLGADGKYHEVTGDIEGLFEDSKLKITVTVTPTKDSKEGTKVSKPFECEKDIKVFIPYITYADSQINLGEKADYSQNFKGLEWKHVTLDENGNVIKTVTPAEAEDNDKAHVVGTAPTLAYTYEPAEDYFKVDQAVKVTVKIAGNDVTQYVKFYREACDFDGCEWTTAGEVTGNDPNFIVHVKSFDLKITKTVDAVEPNQTFLFHIKKDGTDYMDVTVQVGADKTGSVTIKGLPVGSYTVTEDTAWSWRYALTGTNDRAVDLNSGVDGVVTVKFENKLDKHTWLSGETSCENRWSGNRILKNGQPLSK